MAIREKYIDHEEFKIKIKVSSSTNKLIQQDMFRFGYLKGNDELNPNLFLNHLLPIMEKYRRELNDKLRKKFTKAKELKNIDDAIDLINNHYYEDHFDLCDEVINLRIAKENMKVFSNNHKKTSTYLRTLINQYANMILDSREFLFFNDEYNLIGKAIEKNKIILLIYNDNELYFSPIVIVTCPIDNDIFIIGLLEEDNKLYIKAVKLCEIEDINILNEQSTFEIDERNNEEIFEYINSLEYIDNDSKLLGGD